MAAYCQITDDLGLKEKAGILQSMASRTAFLADRTRCIRFVYTPRHCSWINQVERWFSILVRKLRRLASFVSTGHLRAHPATMRRRVLAMSRAMGQERTMRG